MVKRLRRDQDQVDAPRDDLLKDLLPPVFRQTVQGFAAQAHPLGGLDLVLHEDQQRTDHKSDAGAPVPEELCAGEVDQALSPAGALHDEGPAVKERRLDGLVLTVAKMGVWPVQGPEDGCCLTVYLSILYLHGSPSACSFARSSSIVP